MQLLKRITIGSQAAEGLQGDRNREGREKVCERELSRENARGREGKNTSRRRRRKRRDRRLNKERRR